MEADDEPLALIDLPDDALERVLSYCDGESAVAASSWSRGMAAAAQATSHWLRRDAREHPTGPARARSLGNTVGSLTCGAGFAQPARQLTGQ